MDDLIQERDELVNVMESAREEYRIAVSEMNKAINAVVAFDETHPEVMEAEHQALGDAKKAERGSTGTVVTAEGHATLPVAEAEGS